jgi:hypothetical protein
MGNLFWFCVGFSVGILIPLFLGIHIMIGHISMTKLKKLYILFIREEQ